MGVQLGDLVAAREVGFEELAGRRIAIDAFNTLYQFLSIIRQPTGEPLRDSSGRITSHLSGLLYRNANLIELGILPVYVFDGEPPKLKSRVIEERNQLRERAREEWERALREERYEEAWSKAVQSAKLSDEMLADSRRLLSLLGIPYVDAPAEGEAQAAHMAKKGDVFAAGSQDYDSLLFGSPRLVRNLTITGKRKLPRRKVYVEVRPELISLEETLRRLEVTREQLIDIAILIGTDYNPGGVEGIGPKRAYALVKEHGSAEKALEAKGVEADFDVAEIRELFLHHRVTDDYTVEWKLPDRDGVISFLCGERDFSRERVEKALEKMEKALKVTRAQRSLDAWFG
ncbi:MAG: flap endonuclease-1 [Euryarchaeota archaeon]|nr:flap endonuclease-1 [Euryarchaeota archaeon]